MAAIQIKSPYSSPASFPASSRAGAPAPVSRSPRLVDLFCEFYAEVVLLKRMAVPSAQRSKRSTAITPDGVKQRLLDLFEAQAARVGRRFGEHEIRVFEEAQYVMVAMADEVFLRVQWVGREMWLTRPLEAHIFRTYDAGERFFRRLDEALESRVPASTELLTVYLTALALGFRGKYALSGGTEPDEYRRRLVRHLYLVDPAAVRAESELCPEAHAHTESGASRTGLPSLIKGFYMLALVIVGWIALAQMLWYYRTAEISDALDRIEGVL